MPPGPRAAGSWHPRHGQLPAARPPVRPPPPHRSALHREKDLGTTLSARHRRSLWEPLRILGRFDCLQAGRTCFPSKNDNAACQCSTLSLDTFTQLGSIFSPSSKSPTTLQVGLRLTHLKALIVLPTQRKLWQFGFDHAGPTSSSSLCATWRSPASGHVCTVASMSTGLSHQQTMGRSVLLTSLGDDAILKDQVFLLSSSIPFDSF